MIATLAWSVRRELWEHRWAVLTPVFMGLLFILAFAIHQHAEVLGVVVRILLVSGTAVGLAYCSEALHGERRDRSILFWKALPVSDEAAVLSKAAVATVVIPVLTLLLIVAAQVVARALISGGGSAPPPTRWLSFGGAAAEVLAGALWQAPLFGWVLLVSSLVKRVPLLWSMVPLVVIPLLTHNFGMFPALGDAIASRGVLRYLPSAVDLSGRPYAFGLNIMPTSVLVVTAELWAGLAVAAGFFMAAAQVRRRRSPI